MGRRKKLPKILEKEEREQLLSVFNERYPTAQRNKAMIDFMLNAGLRLAETLNLKWEHINLMSGKIEVIEGKGAKDRIVYIKDRVLEVLRSWRERQAKELKKKGIEKPAEYVFTTLEGNQLDQGNIRRMVYKYSKKAGITKKISPHTFRHTFATKLLRDTNNIREVQKALGHEDLSTTMIYTHIVDEQLEHSMKNLRD
ncbi:tyrosine-type recombinase/integrase [Orenia marismortui]|uniref:Integrase/recombinase XerD n=1 Tax=Orenia marismortui TaxID=46469 RepID=A0A4V3GWM2_9FIRM|nr:tyrosine-type recombinase/integrase [Orenia marismortui]TDX44579.1 integrase/recombinase XerD [Orenia marismortui]